MHNDIQSKIAELFYNTFNETHTVIEKLPISGSARSYFRIIGPNYKAVATYNSDVKENAAFLSFSKHFKENGVNVPEIYAVNEDQTIYLQEDLGDESLFDRTQRLRTGDQFPAELIELYKKTIEQLAYMQIVASKGLDYSVAYPREVFDRQSMQWDLNYFKYNFLKLTGIHFYEQALENDFQTLIDFLLKAKTDFFLFRDFKSLNIMVHDEDIFFIDYQGGRKGALHYDPASLLHESKADLPEELKAELLDYYINYAGTLTRINKKDFIEYYHAYSLIRILQAMGTYGYRGLFERKQHYIESIPLRLKSLQSIVKEISILNKMPELKRVLEELPELDRFKPVVKKDKLTVSIKSFSYKTRIPEDTSGNGGGFVFDCRFIHNPGRIEHYKTLCGKDKEVIDFLEADEAVHSFFEGIKQITNASINKYISRDFKHLAVNFGCTGGRHRSVFFAEKLSTYISENFDVYVETDHTEGF